MRSGIARVRCSTRYRWGREDPIGFSPGQHDFEVRDTANATSQHCRADGDRSGKVARSSATLVPAQPISDPQVSAAGGDVPHGPIATTVYAGSQLQSFRPMSPPAR